MHSPCFVTAFTIQANNTVLNSVRERETNKLRRLVTPAIDRLLCYHVILPPVTHSSFNTNAGFPHVELHVKKSCDHISVSDNTYQLGLGVPWTPPW